MDLQLQLIFVLNLHLKFVGIFVVLPNHIAVLGGCFKIPFLVKPINLDYNFEKIFFLHFISNLKILLKKANFKTAPKPNSLLSKPVIPR